MGLSLFLILVGFLLIGVGIYRFRKSFSASFLAKTPYTIASAYGSTPFGLMSVLWGVALSPFINQVWARFLFLAGFIIAVLGTIISIQFLKPAWLQWLEREHHSVIPFLQNEAIEEGYNIADKRIKSRQDLEEWVAEVRRKHGL